jgi:aminocarboxymuconate-semialdehyde decarboxylase
MAKVIDVHTTLYPKIWLEYLEKRKTSPTMERTGPNSMKISVNGYAVSHIERPGHYDPEARIRDMDKAGIDTQVVAVSVPSVETIESREGVEWARRINDYFAEITQKYKGRLYAYAVLPYQDMDAALRELDRAHKELKLKGIKMFSNINGKPITSPEFLPIYAKAEEYDLPIFVHPASPMTLEIMRAHRVSASLYGFLFDTTVAVMSLIWQGVLEKHPALKIIHAHLGAFVPYTVGRLNDCWRNFSQELGLKLKKLPSEYYQDQVYIDTISYFVPAMKCAHEFMGTDHILLGTDYAHSIGNLENAIDWVKKFGLSQKDTDKILGGNAARLFKLG